MWRIYKMAGTKVQSNLHVVLSNLNSNPEKVGFVEI